MSVEVSPATKLTVRQFLIDHANVRGLFQFSFPCSLSLLGDVAEKFGKSVIAEVIFVCGLIKNDCALAVEDGGGVWRLAAWTRHAVVDRVHLSLPF